MVFITESPFSEQLFNEDSASLHNCRHSSNDSVCITPHEKRKRMAHFGPFLTLCLILFISFLTLRCSIQTDGAFSPVTGFVLFALISVQLYLIVMSYFSAMFVGPGFVPLGWKPSNADAEVNLQFCEICHGFKPPRAHHCRSCQRCVMKMDHHCPWINTCCGYLNHGYFFQFVVAAPAGCFSCSVILAISCYWNWIMLPTMLLRYEFNFLPLVFEIATELFALGLAVGVTIAVGWLAVYQLGCIYRNETGIESWIIAKANQWRLQAGKPPFSNPYNLGRWSNVLQVVSWSGQVVGDGVKWPVRDGCGEYDMTIEQIMQKQMKQQHAQRCDIYRAYDGGWWTCWRYTCCTFFSSLCNGDPRLPLLIGDQVLVTRWNRYWLYGQRIQSANIDENNVSNGHKLSAAKGWFPRLCVLKTASSSTGRTRKPTDLKINMSVTEIHTKQE